MAVSVTTLTSGADLTPVGVSSTTASISPTADHPILVAVLCDKVGGALAAPTLSGNGITWTNVASVTFSTLAAPISRLSVFRGSSGAPTTGVITITHSTTPTVVVWWVVDESGGPGSASGAVIQSATNRLDTATSITATLAAFQRAQHGALAFTAVVSGITPAAGSGWTDLGTQSTRLQAEWRADNDTTADSTFAASNAAIVAIELAAAFTLEPIAPALPLQDLTITRTLDAFVPVLPLQDLTITRTLDGFVRATPFQDLVLNQTIVDKTSGAAVAGTGTISSGAVKTKTSGAAITGTGTISSGVSTAKTSGAAVTGTGTISSGASRTKTSGAVITGVGTISSGVAIVKTSGAAVVGVGKIALRTPAPKKPGKPIDWCRGSRQRPGT